MITGLRSDDGRDCSKEHHGEQRPGGIEQEEGVLQAGRIGQQHGSLAEVVERQGWKYEAEPCSPEPAQSGPCQCREPPLP